MRSKESCSQPGWNNHERERGEKIIVKLTHFMEEKNGVEGNWALKPVTNLLTGFRNRYSEKLERIGTSQLVHASTRGTCAQC